MGVEVRGAAKVTFGNGDIKHWMYAPDIPYHSGEAEVLATVFQLCLKGDIASIEPALVEVSVPEGSNRYHLIGEVATNSSLLPPTA